MGETDRHCSCMFVFGSRRGFQSVLRLKIVDFTLNRSSKKRQISCLRKCVENRGEKGFKYMGWCVSCFLLRARDT